MQKNQNQKGFSHAESLLVLVIVAILGLTGWYVYNANKKTNVSYKSADQIANSASPKYSKLNSSAKPQTTKPIVSIFKIPEFGIEITNVPTTLRGMTYSVRAVNNVDIPYTSAGFTTSTLLKEDASCTAEAGGGSIGSLKYYKGNYGSASQYGPIQFVKQFQGFWIGFLHNGVPCTQDQSALNLESSQMSAFSALVTNPSNLQEL